MTWDGRYAMLEGVCRQAGRGGAVRAWAWQRIAGHSLPSNKMRGWKQRGRIVALAARVRVEAGFAVTSAAKAAEVQ